MVLGSELNVPEFAATIWFNFLEEEYQTYLYLNINGELSDFEDSMGAGGSGCFESSYLEEDL